MDLWVPSSKWELLEGTQLCFLYTLYSIPKVTILQLLFQYWKMLYRKKGSSEWLSSLGSCFLPDLGSAIFNTLYLKASRVYIFLGRAISDNWLNSLLKYKRDSEESEITLFLPLQSKNYSLVFCLCLSLRVCLSRLFFLSFLAHLYEDL